MKRALLCVFLLFGVIFALGSTETCAGQRSYEDFVGKGLHFGVEAGDIYADVARDIFSAGQVSEFTNTVDKLAALSMGRLDGVLMGEMYVRHLQDTGIYPQFEYIWLPEDVHIRYAGHVFHTSELRGTFNEWFETAAVPEGIWEEVTDRWLRGSLPAEEDVPRFNLTGENGVLRVPDTGNYPPMSYLDSRGDVIGFNVDLISRFAEYLGKSLDITLMAYDGIIPFVLSGRADMSAVTMTISDERGESVLFSHPTVITQTVLIVNRLEGDVEEQPFAGKRIANITGALTYKTTEQLGAVPEYYSDSASAIEAVRRGRVDGFMTTYSAARIMARELGSDIFETLPVPKDVFFAEIGAISMDSDIINSFNIFLSEIETDGILAEMQERWFGGDADLDAPIPEIPNNGENGILTVATSFDSMPYVFLGQGGEPTGFSAELALRFGAYLGKQTVIQDVDFGGLIPYIINGRADISIANMAITDERRESVLFSNPYVEEQHGILVLRQFAPDTARDYTWLAGKNIGGITGNIFDVVAESLGATPVYFTETSSALEDLHRGRIDAYMNDLSMVRVLETLPANTLLEVIPVPAEFFQAPMGALSMNQELIDRFDEFLAIVKADGTIADMQARWLEVVPDLYAPMPEITLTGENGTIIVATTGTDLPFTYFGANNELKGYSIELITRFAEFEGLAINFQTMEFGGLIPYVVSGRADMAIGSVSITEERRQIVIFSESIYDDTLGALVRKQVENIPVVQEQTTGTQVLSPPQRQTFFEWLETGIRRNLITDNRWRLIVSGLGVTMTISLLAQFFGTLFAGVVCCFLTRKNKLIKWIGNLYCGLINGTPVVVLLMITYYIIFGTSRMSNVLMAVFAFSMVTGAGVAQTLRGAIETIDPVEIEAARSIGFSAFRAFTTVTFPQAVRRALPAYTRGFVELVKATAIVGYIAIQDLTRAADIIRSRTFDAYFPLLLVALIYLTVTTVCIQLFKFIVNKINRGAAL